MGKPQNLLGRAEAKRRTVARLKILAEFCDDVGVAQANPALLAWARTFDRMAHEVVNGGPGRWLPPEAAAELVRFAEMLVNAHPTLRPRLQELQSLIKAAIRRVGKPGFPPAYNLSGIINDLMPRIKRGDDLAREVVDAASTDPSPTLAVASLLLINAVRVETIEDAFIRQLREAIESFSLGSRFSPERMCSVYRRIPRTGGGKKTWRTDVRAVRDATAHAHFTFGAGAVLIDNSERGYNFKRDLTAKDLGMLIDRHTMLYKMQLHLLLTYETLILLTTHFVSKPGRK